MPTTDNTQDLLDRFSESWRMAEPIEIRRTVSAGLKLPAQGDMTAYEVAEMTKLVIKKYIDDTSNDESNMVVHNEIFMKED